MKSKMPLILGSGFVAIVILAWTLIIALNVGFESVFAIVTGEAKARIESLGQLGASYGILASIFAGFAVVLLRQSITVQQRELTELRRQMLHDRNVTEFTWLLNGLESARVKASRANSNLTLLFGSKHGKVAPGKDQISGHKLIYEEAVSFLKKRKGGDYYPESDTDGFITQNRNEDEAEEGFSWDPLLPFYLSVRQVAKYLYNLDADMRGRLYPMFASITTIFDMVLIHERILINGDKEFQSFVERTNLFSEYGAVLVKELKGGPIMNSSAFGANVDGQ